MPPWCIPKVDLDVSWTKVQGVASDIKRPPFGIVGRFGYTLAGDQIDDGRLPRAYFPKENDIACTHPGKRRRSGGSVEKGFNRGWARGVLL